MALDLPEFDRPANATSAPTSSGNCSSLAADSRKRTLGNWLMRGLGLDSTGASVQFAAFQGARKTMIESRFSLSLAAAVRLRRVGFARTAVAEEAVKGSAEAGATKAGVCTACHGVNGNSTNPEWPVLAGQNAAYIREQLAMFKARKRINEIMYPIVAPMSEQDFADVAAFFAAQTPAGLEADPSYWKAGEALYQSGDARAQHSRLHRLPRARRARAIRAQDTRRCARSIRSTP